MMTRNILVGAAATGVSAFAAGYAWVAFEFPFAILLPAVVGLLAVTLPLFAARRAVLASIIGGLAFLAAFMIALFLALTDGSPLAILPSLGSLLAAAVAGAIAGAILRGRAGALALGAFSAAGMLVGVAIVLFMRTVAPGSIDAPGAAQNLYFATTIGLLGVALGAFVGLGAWWVHDRM